VVRLPATALALLITLCIPFAQADELTVTQTVDELVVFLTLDPASALIRDPMHEFERQMHRGNKPGGKIYHVQVELFEQASGARTTDVEEVSAFVVDSNGRSPPAHMEWMVREGNAGWGNYLDFGDSGPYEISLSVRLKRSMQPVTTSFRFAQLPP
jgi:hypothetical protein